jgi:hypothetical protein
LAIEMAIEIKSPFFNGLDFFCVFFPTLTMGFKLPITTKMWISQPKILAIEMVGPNLNHWI